MEKNKILFMVIGLVLLAIIGAVITEKLFPGMGFYKSK